MIPPLISTAILRNGRLATVVNCGSLTALHFRERWTIDDGHGHHSEPE